MQSPLFHPAVNDNAMVSFPFVVDTVLRIREC